MMSNTYMGHTCFVKFDGRESEVYDLDAHLRNAVLCAQCSCVSSLPDLRAGILPAGEYSTYDLQYLRRDNAIHDPGKAGEAGSYRYLTLINDLRFRFEHVVSVLVFELLVDWMDRRGFKSVRVFYE